MYKTLKLDVHPALPTNLEEKRAETIQGLFELTG